MRRIVLIFILVLALVGIGVRAASTAQTYLPIVYKAPATPTPTRTPTPTQTPTPTSTPIPSGVQILPISYTFVSPISGMIVIGEVLNNTSDSLALIKVTVNFIDNSGHLVGTDFTYLFPLNLPAWDKGCFRISMDVPQNWSYYQFEVPTYILSSSSSGLTIINDSGAYNPGNGDYDIIGQVRNDGAQQSNSVSVGGTVYNASGVPVGCEYTYVNSTDLAPGQVSSFAMNYWHYDRNYGDVTSYRLRVTGNMP